MEITYQKATDADIEPIYALCRALIDTYEDIGRIDYLKVLRWVHEKIRRAIGEYTVIYANGEKAGYYHFFKNGDGVYELDDLYVFEPFQNRGIGTQVLRRCCSAVNEPVMLYAFKENRRAVSLYRRMGFEIIKTVHETRYVMQRDVVKGDGDT